MSSDPLYTAPNAETPADNLNVSSQAMTIQRTHGNEGRNSPAKVLQTDSNTGGYTPVSNAPITQSNVSQPVTQMEIRQSKNSAPQKPTPP